ncbi:uncharacterized protein TRIADDRAFT_27759 [Trichoplax adhaerens]|uniref:Vacuole membrane protein 1 n=1 Tax=Trichoplax adhaerens TaxID=10228 RepID=B3S1K5_TRIAD|nr:hypothetical protein TRIADDRAFT_27759 [Trichoplax adhaerens]EDV23243.1 hypothetical protein TRIADDRAFT_27759 [Trichoplax adhaerens]|eukprot:XP_002114153.1 hypothetical protein TRIADDRAFT_27759 [Trichoplax adhaerens]
MSSTYAPIETKDHNGKVPPSPFLTRSQEEREELHREREKRAEIVLWRKPLVTLSYFFRELFIDIRHQSNRLVYHNRKKFSAIGLMIFSLFLLYLIDGEHQQYYVAAQKQIFWCFYWIGLGVLSSIGLGTGLHTFILYLGPHIARVTLAAWECGSVDFPEPPYPNDIICPDEEGDKNLLTLWTIMGKVRLESMMWGLGTAVGELPPYFMARAARLSGSEIDMDDEEIEEMEAMLASENKDVMTRVKKAVHNLVQKAGFFGILLCASIPNPLFDLAGITCGHFLVPFWTFFGATAIGKAIVKMHIQKLLVIVTFSNHHVESLTEIIGNIPHVGNTLKKPFVDYIDHQKHKLHREENSMDSPSNLVTQLYSVLVIFMVSFFALSIVNSMAQKYAKRLDDERRYKVKDK